MKHITIALWFVGMLSAVTAAASDLTIVNNGASDYEILVARQAYPVTVSAAEDLQHYIAKATGVRLPMRRADAIGRRLAIVVGDCAAARKAGVSLDHVPAEGFRIKTVGPNLYIVGHDTAGDPLSVHWNSAPQAGTWSGVSEFLEAQLGIRWFYPGEIREIVPDSTALVVHPIDFQNAPKMVLRKMSYLTPSGTQPKRSQAVRYWLRRNRQGWSVGFQGAHSWKTFFKGETYFKDHPEWFALVNGKRQGHRKHGLQMCTTNPEALDEFARVIIEYCNNTHGAMFSLSPNDGGDKCECKNCRALDVAAMKGTKGEHSDRIVTYANAVVKRVCKVLPNQRFGMYLYGNYRLPPVNVQLDPRVTVMDVFNDSSIRYYSEKVRQEHLNQRLLPWKKRVGQLFFYGTPEGIGNLDLPAMNKEGIGYLYANLRRAGVTGFVMNNTESFASTGLNNYLYLRMAWNPDQPIDAVYGDALERCYGKKAAPHIRAYFALVEQRMQAFTDYAIRTYNPSMGASRRFPYILDKVYLGLKSLGLPLLQKALAATETGRQRRCIGMHIANLEYADMTARLYQLSTRVLGVKNASPRDIQTCLELAKTREAFMRRHGDGAGNFGPAEHKFEEAARYRSKLAFLNPKQYEKLVTSKESDQ